ncbi:lytic murein transglycosylase B [Parashewanella spongiae]|uniref:Lytic murein transglycosylase B n=1 Tax=Parashewanella spongiae TaxID=342950 RepID=A0A3A6TKH3_9GAMM|nr:lytic murein transglycosylase B [Parashewanella spongiae]MCL1078652.1 lytic murein transglycosylase B [Parashewanella spongiae]RJY16312.1 lytic murein transglycosylase B [Parashewanella spongiae]
MRLISSAVISLVICAVLPSYADETSAPEVLKSEFIAQQVRNGMTKQEVTSILDKAHFQQTIIDSISRPWEAKPWYQYYPIFLTDNRLEAGLSFWKKNKDVIARAAKKFQVDPQIIVAIIGVETYYGKYLGKHSVLDALYTLGFYYPPRAKFFRGQLGDLLKLTKEEHLDINNLKGSYAGAMGYGQFIPSSYRYYAVDFDGNGSRDLIGSPADAIGSVANYLHKHGWQKGMPTTIELVNESDSAPETAPWSGKRLKLKAADILTPQLHLKHSIDIDIAQPAILIELQQESDKEYWLGLKNFYVITRYNHSPLYAMAVYQFSQQLKQSYEKQAHEKQ